MQLIHDARAHLHQSMPMPQSLPQIPIRCIRDPDPRKTIFHQKLQQQLRILAIGLLLSYPLRTNLRSVPNPQLKLQLGQHTLEPACVSTGFHPYTHTPLLECAVKLLGFLAVSQSPLADLTCSCVHKCNLLEARMIVTSYNHLLEPGVMKANGSLNRLFLLLLCFLFRVGVMEAVLMCSSVEPNLPFHGAGVWMSWGVRLLGHPVDQSSRCKPAVQSTLRNQRRTAMAQKVIDVVGTSKESFAKAAENAVAEAAKTVRGMKWARVTELEMELDGKKIVKYRVTTKIYFDIEK
jgi:flavin-binding protein dodecin